MAPCWNWLDKIDLKSIAERHGGPTPPGATNYLESFNKKTIKEKS